MVHVRPSVLECTSCIFLSPTFLFCQQKGLFKCICVCACKYMHVHFHVCILHVCK